MEFDRQNNPMKLLAYNEWMQGCSTFGKVRDSHEQQKNVLPMWPAGDLPDNHESKNDLKLEPKSNLHINVNIFCFNTWF